jgi:O-antigen ligase
VSAFETRFRQDGKIRKLTDALRIGSSGNRLTYDRVNRGFTVLVYVGAGIAGSAASILVIGAALWAIVRIFTGSISLTRDRAAWISAFSLSSIFIADALSLAAHGDLPYLFSNGIYAVIFLTPILFYSGFELSQRGSTAFAVQIGAVIGAIAAVAIALWFWHFKNAMRIEGFSGNASVFGQVAAVLFALLVPSVIVEAGWRWRALFFGGAFCAAFAAAASGTRSLLPFIAIFPPTVAWLMREDMKGFGKRRFWLGIAAFALLLPIATMPFLGWRLDLLWRMLFAPDSFSQGTLTPLSARQAIWTVAWEGFRQNPWFGVGGANLRHYINAGTARLLGEGLRVSHAHNVFLNYLLRDGLFGLAAIVAILLQPFILKRQFQTDATGRWAYAAMVGLFTCYFFSGLFGLMFGHDVFDSLFVFTFAVLLFIGCHRQTGNSDTAGDAELIADKKAQTIP